MTENLHPLTETAAAELWDAHRDPSAAPFHAQGRLYRRGQTALIRAAFDAGREHVSADPHHDPRPWEDCTREDIREGDLVEVRITGNPEIGIAHHQGRRGDWYTELGCLLSFGDYWPLRRIPAPTPPAEEVELPDEFGAVITDVEMRSGEQYDRMVYTECFWAYDAASYESKYVAACTLPDGTRARRDGEHEDGTPRFVKVEDGQ